MDHLIEPVKILALKSNAERMHIMNDNRWIKYPAAEKILTRLEELLIHPKISRMPNLLIVGETNNGKTILMNRFFSLHKRFTNEQEERLIVPVVYMQAPPVPDEKRFYNQLLRSISAPHRINDKIEHKEQQSFKILQRNQTRMLIIDEIHNILAGSSSKQRAFLNVIKNMANELQIVIVAAGIREALNAMNTDPQLSNRFVPAYLPKWQYNEDFIRLLASYERLLPLHKPSGLISEHLSQKILELSEGTIGEISRVLTIAAIDAIKTGKEKIDMPILKSLDYIQPSQRRRSIESLL